MTMPAAVEQLLASGAAVHTELMFHMVAKNRATGADEPLSVWTGEGDRVFDIGGNRTYRGGGALIDIPPITYSAGLTINYIEVTLSGAAPFVRTAMFTHNPKFAPVEIHVAFYSAATLNFVGLWRPFKGIESESDLSRAPRTGQQVYQIKCASSARQLTLKSTRRKSNQAMTASNPGDTFRKFAAAVKSARAQWKG
ncbi:MAG: hypothetical protein RQ750_14655 [Roseovarius sp.]|nr:hypothetical protein [Roseovarius sp.]